MVAIVVLAALVLQAKTDVLSKRTKAAQQLLAVAGHYHQKFAEEGDTSIRSKAIDYYVKAIKIDPASAGDAHGNLGSLLFTENAIEEAQHHFATALRLKDNQGAALHFNLALLLSEYKQKHQEAANHCYKAIAQKPGFVKAHHLLGNVLQSIGTAEALAKANEQFRMADSLSGKNKLQFSAGFYALTFPTSRVGATLPHQYLLSSSPHLSRIEGLLTASECRYIIKEAEARDGMLQPSGTTNDASGSRLSRSGFMAVAGDSVLERVRERVLAQLALPRLGELFHVEELQVVQYGEGGHYSFHHDSTAFLRRFLTVIIYLTDSEGGGTVFPLIPHREGEGSEQDSNSSSEGHSRAVPASTAAGLVLEDECAGGGRGLLVRPAAGDAVVFRNYAQSTGLLEPAVVHAACPVTKGEKWAVNLWIRLRDGVTKLTTGTETSEQAPREEL
jgi:prolyl 4-hydroxylase